MNSWPVSSGSETWYRKTSTQAAMTAMVRTGVCWVGLSSWRGITAVGYVGHGLLGVPRRLCPRASACSSSLRLELRDRRHRERVTRAKGDGEAGGMRVAAASVRSGDGRDIDPIRAGPEGVVPAAVPFVPDVGEGV